MIILDYLQRCLSQPKILFPNSETSQHADLVSESATSVTFLFFSFRISEEKSAELPPELLTERYVAGREDVVTRSLMGEVPSTEQSTMREVGLIKAPLEDILGMLATSLVSAELEMLQID